MDELGGFEPTDTTGFIQIESIRLKKCVSTIVALPYSATHLIKFLYRSTWSLTPHCHYLRKHSAGGARRMFARARAASNPKMYTDHECKKLGPWDWLVPTNSCTFGKEA